MAHDPLWMRVFPGVHVAAGASSFLLAPVALATAKGGKAHRRWGMVYLRTIGIVVATALPMALYRPVLFLALVAVFSFHAAFSEYRVTKLKELARGGSARPIDWFAGVVRFCLSAALAGLAAFKPAAEQNMGIVAIVFGILEMRLAATDLMKFVRQHQEKMFWWYTHLGDLIGSYIAAWTAFSVVTLPRVFGNHYDHLADPDADWDAGDHVDDDLLRAEVCAPDEDGCGLDLRLGGGAEAA